MRRGAGGSNSRGVNLAAVVVLWVLVPLLAVASVGGLVAGVRTAAHAGTGDVWGTFTPTSIGPARRGGERWRGTWAGDDGTALEGVRLVGAPRNVDPQPVRAVWRPLLDDDAVLTDEGVARESWVNYPLAALLGVSAIGAAVAAVHLTRLVRRSPGAG